MECRNCWLSIEIRFRRYLACLKFFSSSASSVKVRRWSFRYFLTLYCTTRNYFLAFLSYILLFLCLVFQSCWCLLLNCIVLAYQLSSRFYFVCWFCLVISETINFQMWSSKNVVASVEDQGWSLFLNLIVFFRFKHTYCHFFIKIVNILHVL